MAIVTVQSNEGQNSNPGQQTNANANAGAGAGPTAIKLTDMFAKLSSHGGWSGEAADYLQEIRKIIEDPGMTIKAKMTYLSDDSVAFSVPASKICVVLVRESDIANPLALVADAKFFTARDACHAVFGIDFKVLNIVSCNRFMFNRPNQMAAYITQVLTAQTDDQITNFNISNFGSQYQINVDTDMSNVRQFFDAHSTTNVVSGDFGFITSLVDKSDNANRLNNYNPGTPMFGVTGYVEFIRHEATGVLTPMVHVTDILSVLASPKIMAIALPLIGEVLIGNNLWRQPYTSIGKSDINIGNLIVDQASQKPLEVKNDADFRKLFHDWIGAPILCIDIKCGAASIPGINKITRSADHDLFAREIYDFLNISPAISDGGLGQNIFKEIIGVVETSKSSKFTNLMDTRDVTYLFAVSKLKWSPKLDVLLRRSDNDPVRRFEMIRDIIGEVTPTHSSITTMLSGPFIRRIAETLASKVTVNMPTSSDLPSIDLTNFANKAYQPGIAVFGQANASSFGGGYSIW